VKGKRAFAALAASTYRARRGAVSVRYVPPGEDRPEDVCVAFAIGRTVGSAVVRNRVRRRLRSALAELEVPVGTWLVSVSPEAAALDYEHLSRDVAEAVAAIA
jgi:ribonuclease P protein component